MKKISESFLTRVLLPFVMLLVYISQIPVAFAMKLEKKETLEKDNCSGGGGDRG